MSAAGYTRSATLSPRSILSLRLWQFTGSALVNLLACLLLLCYLFPISYMVVTAFRHNEQIQDRLAPWYPAEAILYTYQGQQYQVYEVPTAEGVKEWALISPRRAYSEFIDPAHPEAGPIRWEGSWRSLRKVYRFGLAVDNFVNLWKVINFPQFVRNTLIVAFLGEIGVLCSSIAVAYGFSRFKIPGGDILFFILVATIILPEKATLVPTYFLFVRVFDWNGSWLPLIVPHFFGSAIFIFLLRQNFKSIPKEQDEAAMLDGAGPLRILLSIILPQSIPVVLTVALIFFYYAWNETRIASLYLGVSPDLRTVSFGVQSYQSLFPPVGQLQASALIVLVVPVIILFLSQRFFMQHMVVTGMEK